MRGYKQSKNGNNKVPRDGAKFWYESQDYYEAKLNKGETWIHHFRYPYVAMIAQIKSGHARSFPGVSNETG